MLQEIITIKLGKKIIKILNISAVLEKPTKLKTILLFFKFWVPPIALTIIKITFEKTYQLKNIHIKKIGIQGTSLGNVGRINALNK